MHGQAAHGVIHKALDAREAKLVLAARIGFAARGLVFALIEAGQMQKTDEDTIEDFRGVFDFKTVFETEYRIPQPA